VSTDLKTILQLRVPVIVQIARQRMPMETVLALGPGAILEFEKSADDELDLLVNNKAVGKGAAVKVGENFGLRLTAIGGAQQRLAAMQSERSGGSSPQGSANPGGGASTDDSASAGAAGNPQQGAASGSTEPTGSTET
jgi:flagellar motor switch protein FliN/FliY